MPAYASPLGIQDSPEVPLVRSQARPTPGVFRGVVFAVLFEGIVGVSAWMVFRACWTLLHH